MKSPKHFFSIFLLSWILLSPEAFSQQKFELGVNIEPLVIPINFGTYVEKEPAYYDIHGAGKITQAGSAYIRYWPFKAVGVSVGAGWRSFHSSVDFELVDAFNAILSPGIKRSHPFMAKGRGPTCAVLWRMGKWKASIGLSYFNLYDRQFTPSSRVTTVTTRVDGEVISKIHVEEEAYWGYTAPSSYGFLQFEGQYNVFKNLYVKFGFETTMSSQYPYPYTLLITGFTPQTSQEDHVLNDFKVRNKLSSVSFGVGYTFGFGKYKRDSHDIGFRI